MVRFGHFGEASLRRRHLQHRPDHAAWWRATRQLQARTASEPPSANWAWPALMLKDDDEFAGGASNNRLAAVYNTRAYSRCWPG